MADLPRSGDVVLGRYRVEEPLASGGMGLVVRATHLELNQSVALKFITPSSLDPAVAAERFLREARATFRLRSEFTVRVLDAGTLPNGSPVMVMELLEGKDLKGLIAERGQLPAAEAVQYAVQVCDALGEAHALGVVHRDLKARNIFITKRVDGSPCAKVLDFGISKIADEGHGPLTAPDVALGSPRYMAPEQWQSAATVDARADIYALGAVLYEMLTGKIPLAGIPLEELIKRIAAGAIPSPRELRPDLSEPLSRAVLKALRPHPDERFPTAGHFAAALRAAIPAGATNKPKPNFAMTSPTAVMNHELLMAQARISANPTPPLGHYPVSEAVPSTDENPLSSTADELPALSSTLDDAPAVVDPRYPIPNFDEKTAVSQQAPTDRQNFAATLPVGQAPPGVADLMSASRRPAPVTEAMPPALPAPPAPPQFQPIPAPAPQPVMSMGVRNSAPPHMATVNRSGPVPIPPVADVGATQRSSAPPPAPVHGGYGAPPPVQGYGYAPQTYPPQGSGGFPRVSVPPAPPPKKKSGATWIVVALVIITLCLGAGLAIGFALYRVEG